jgi:hypothetical protein
VEDHSQILTLFNHLLRDIECGETARTCFQPWEVELLIDLDSCPLGDARGKILRRYQRAVRRSLESGASTPLKLSEYLSRRKSRPRVAALS